MFFFFLNSKSYETTEKIEFEQHKSECTHIRRPKGMFASFTRMRHSIHRCMVISKINKWINVILYIVHKTNFKKQKRNQNKNQIIHSDTALSLSIVLFNYFTYNFLSIYLVLLWFMKLFKITIFMSIKRILLSLLLLFY